MTAPADLIELLEDAREGDPEAVRKLADIVAEAIKRPDRSVGAALMPKRRGGVSEWQAEQLAERNAGYRDFAVAECGTSHLTPNQARALNRKIDRLLTDVHLIERGVSPQRDALRRIRASGLRMIGDRQLLNVLNRSAKKSGNPVGPNAFHRRPCPEK